MDDKERLNRRTRLFNSRKCVHQYVTEEDILDGSTISCIADLHNDIVLICSYFRHEELCKDLSKKPIGDK